MDLIARIGELYKGTITCLSKDNQKIFGEHFNPWIDFRNVIYHYRDNYEKKSIIDKLIMKEQFFDLMQDIVVTDFEKHIEFLEKFKNAVKIEDNKQREKALTEIKIQEPINIRKMQKLFVEPFSFEKREKQLTKTKKLAIHLTENKNTFFAHFVIKDGGQIVRGLPDPSHVIGVDKTTDEICVSEKDYGKMEKYSYETIEQFNQIRKSRGTLAHTEWKASEEEINDTIETLSKLNLQN